MFFYKTTYPTCPSGCTLPSEPASNGVFGSTSHTHTHKTRCTLGNTAVNSVSLGFMKKNQNRKPCRMKQGRGLQTPQTKLHIIFIPQSGSGNAIFILKRSFFLLRVETTSYEKTTSDYLRKCLFYTEFFLFTSFLLFFTRQVSLWTYRLFVSLSLLEIN